ncbi:hypothetical protein [Psychrobacter glacincola]|uniref:hypothetical protein n=1 Tax=Psychrobacter glacincola TaxID=56810 RepID=UPI0019191CA5|nr:hypothetical protein [Psychrobacter glacincola]
MSRIPRNWSFNGCLQKAVFEKIGYYDDTRFGGDSEYISRFKSKFGTQKLHLIKKPLTEAYYGVNNISHAIADKSEIRKAYADGFKIKHKLMKNLIIGICLISLVIISLSIVRKNIMVVE